MILKVKPVKCRVIKESLTGAEVYAKYKPDFLINGGLYDTETGSVLTRIKADGASYGYMFSDFGIGFDGDIVGWCSYKDSVPNFVGGSPTLIRESQEFIDWGNTYSSYVDGTHYRSIIGFKNNEVILYYVSDEPESLKSAIRRLLVEKVKYAINLDGGGSCHLQYKDKIYRSSTRKNASWILIWGDEVMKTNEDLVLHATTALIEKWGYVYGTWGLILTNILLNQKFAQYPDEIKDYLDFIKKNYIGIRTTDCGGLIKSFLWWKGNSPVYNPSNDVGVNTMYNQATEKGVINSIPEIPGLIVWKDNHAGVYIGNGDVIEAMGTKYGVVLTKLKDRPWTHWFKHKDIEYIVHHVEQDDISEWAIDPRRFVKDNKISDGLRPKDNVTREEVWTMLYRYKNNVKEV